MVDRLGGQHSVGSLSGCQRWCPQQWYRICAMAALLKQLGLSWDFLLVLWKQSRSGYNSRSSWIKKISSIAQLQFPSCQLQGQGKQHLSFGFHRFSSKARAVTGARRTSVSLGKLQDWLFSSRILIFVLLTIAKPCWKASSTAGTSLNLRTGEDTSNCSYE